MQLVCQTNQIDLKEVKATSDPDEFRFGVAESTNGNASSDSLGLPYRGEVVQIRRLRQAIAAVARKTKKPGTPSEEPGFF